MFPSVGGQKHQKNLVLPTPVSELDVVKGILLREGYIERIRSLVGSSKINQITDLFDLFRICSLEVVELIEQWQKGLKSSSPFIWNGLNYLLKMPSDLDFLSKFELIRKWLGFDTKRNPFIIAEPFSGITNAIEGFVSIGGNAIPRESLPKKKDMKRSRKEHPFASRKFGQNRKRVRKPLQKNTSASASSLSVEDLDRIHRAEAAILQEEQIHGVYVCDTFGRLVPSNETSENRQMEQSDFFTSIGTINKSNSTSDLGRSTIEKKRAAKQSGYLAPLTKKHASGVRKPPRRKAGTAALDLEITRTAKEVKRMAKLLGQLKEDLRIEQEELLAIQEGKTNSGSKDAVVLREALVQKRRRQLQEQQHELARRQAELAKKQKLREQFQKQQQYLSEQRKRKLLESKRREAIGSLEGMEERPVAVQELTIEDIAAMQIQRIARGIRATKLVKQRRRMFNRAALAVQTSARGWFARRLVRYRMARKKAAIKIQKHVRGLLCRVNLAADLQKRMENNAACRIQALCRGRHGRIRMNNRKKLLQHTVESDREHQRLSPDDLMVLAQIAKPIPQLLGLLQCLLIVTDGGQNLPIVQDFTWEVVQSRLKRSGPFLAGMKVLNDTAFQWRLVIPSIRIQTVKSYFLDPSFTENAFHSLGPPSSVARSLMLWLTHILKAHELLKEFLESMDDRLIAGNCLGEELKIIRDGDVEIEEPEKDDLFAEIAKQDSVSRPRPLLIVLARDVAAHPKENIVEGLMNLMPGLFTRINPQPNTNSIDGKLSVANRMTELEDELLKKRDFNSKALDVEVLQNLLDQNRSLIVDLDIGLSASSRQAFLAAFDSCRLALAPSPLCVLVQGNSKNRHGQTDLGLGVSADDIRCMQDGDLKRHLETMADTVQYICSDSAKLEMKHIVMSHSPPKWMTLVLESVIILMSPNRHFSNPHDAVGFVSWHAARKLLEKPDVFCKRIRLVNVNTIPSCNIAALDGYISHCDWPVQATMSSHPILSALCSWVLSATKYAKLLMPRGGPAPRILKRHGIFASVLTVSDAKGPVSQQGDYSGSAIGEGGWADSLTNLMVPLLRDMRVYSEARRIDGIFMTCTVFKDLQKLYFLAYDPKTSLQRLVSINEAEVPALLKPNSIDVKDNREPPKTQREMLSRLCGMLRLQKPKPNGQKEVGGSTLVLRRPFLRLFRRCQRIDGAMVTVTASESAAGELQITVYDPLESKTHKLVVNQDTAMELCYDASGKESNALRSREAREFAPYVADRLHFRKIRGFRMLSVRKKGGGGRLLFQGAKKLSGVYSVITVFELDENLLIRVFIPSTGRTEKFCLNIMQRALVLGTTLSAPKAWSNELFRRLSVFNHGFETSVVLNRLLHRRSLKLGTTWCTVSVFMEETPEMTIAVYQPETSKNFIIKMPNETMHQILMNEGILWPQSGISSRSTCMDALLKALVWNIGRPVLAGIVGILMSKNSSTKMNSKSKKIKSSDVIRNYQSKSSSEPEATENSNKENVLLRRKQDRSDAKFGLVEGVHLFQKGFAVNYLVMDKNGAFKPDSTPHRYTRVSAKILREKSSFEELLVLELYEPSRCKHFTCKIPLDGDPLLEVLGSKQYDMTDMKSREEMCVYIINNRLSVVKDISGGKEDIYLLRAQLCGTEKVTHMPKEVSPNKSLDVSSPENMALNLSGPKEKVIKAGHRRGIKLCTVGLKLEDSFATVTIFDHSSEVGDESVPKLRFLAYDPKTSLKSTLTLDKKQFLDFATQSEIANVLILAKTTAKRLRVRIIPAKHPNKSPRMQLFLPTETDLENAAKERRRAVAKQKRIEAVGKKKIKKEEHHIEWKGAVTIQNHRCVVNITKQVNALVFHVYCSENSVSGELIVPNSEWSTVLSELPLRSKPEWELLVKRVKLDIIQVKLSEDESILLNGRTHRAEARLSFLTELPFAESKAIEPVSWHKLFRVTTRNNGVSIIITAKERIKNGSDDEIKFEVYEPTSSQVIFF
eukprot:TRINITY_DN1766_c0_g1_i2.p1 TRINITY_DN1766_c0_g1~~TRINITY_DN1766_c0_g1_i2.p1  ORF type:complete len:1982 (-),score=316.11 TRINITY_DN1766_c0_g1_i2:313-6258(-)